MAEPGAPATGEVASPCRRECRYLPAAGICGGCGRTLAEIEAWPAADAETRKAIIARAAARLASRAGADDHAGNAP